MDIFDDFKSKNSVEAEPSTGNDIFDEFKSTRSPTTQAAPGPVAPVKEKVRTGIGALERFPGLAPSVAMGIVDTGNTLSLGAEHVTDTINRLFKNPGGRAERTQENIDKVNKLYNEKYGDLPGAGVGRAIGNVIGTAPLIPSAAIAKTMKTGFGALPTTTGVGVNAVTKAAPLSNRLGAAGATGAVVGGEFGALTSAASPDDFSEHVGKNILGGMVGGPVVEGGATLAGKVVPFVRQVLNNSSVNSYASVNGMSPWAVKNILNELENTGLSVAEARTVLQKLGPKATLADVDAALQKEVGALSQRGGRPTSIVEGRFAERAATANDEAQKIMETRLGSKPDVVIERGKILGDEAKAIQNQAQSLTKADYEAAKLNPTKLSVYSLIGDINTQLETAVGKEANALKEVKGYLYKTVKDPISGQPVQSVKTSVKDLHAVRRGIDDIINDRKDTLPSNALSAIQKVRDAVDTQLKSVPEMLAADTKYAEKMKIKEGLQIGYEALTSGNHQTFKAIFDKASPELQETIRKGLRAAIGDKMQSAAKGELAGAQQLFKAKNDTREKLKTAFGSAGEEVLDALTKQATLRATEQMVATGSRTAINQRINAKYDNAVSPPGPLSEAVKGIGGDIIAGTPGAVAVTMGARRAGGNIVNRMHQRRIDINAEHTADILSRSGPELDKTLDTLHNVSVIQNTIGHKLKLPVRFNEGVKGELQRFSAPIGEPQLEKIKEGGKTVGKLGKHWYRTAADFMGNL